jgi:polysaccharide biosynthesis transport protein
VRELAMVLFRRRKVFVCVWGLVLAAAVLYAFVGVKYEANMKVLVRRGRADAPVSAGEDAPIDLTRMAITEEELNSEVELLRDDEVLRRVVEETGLVGHDWLHFLRPGEGDAQRMERAARRLAKNLQVEPMKKTNLIAVSYAADDPRVAAKVLQAVANAYLEKHTEVHRPTGEFHFYEMQTGESRQQLEESKQKLLSFTASNGVVEAGEQRDLALRKLSELDATYRQTRIDLAETQQRVRGLEGQLAKLPERTTTQVRSADNPELQKALKASLLDLQFKRTQLLTKFEPSHRLVQEVDHEIVQAEAAIATENSLPLRDETTDKNTHYEWAKSELQQAEVQLKGLQARQAATFAQLTDYRATAQKLGEDAITQDDLVSSEKAAQENHLLYVRKQEEARMDDALDARGIVNVAIAEHPVAPALPVWSVWSVLAIGFMAAGAAGTGAAFAADYADPAFRTPDDVLAYLNTPVLASLPRSRRGSLSA